MILATAVALAFVAAHAAPVHADQWNDKIRLELDAPMLVPGATLAPGAYVFKLLDSPANRHVVQIFNGDETKLIATAQAVPTKRLETKGDVVLRLNPTEAGAPAAIKAYFYPGSRYGHEFVYPDAQARDIARRTKTLVLSGEVPGNDNAGKGTLHTYDADGNRAAWQEDASVREEWKVWSAGRQASARAMAPGAAETREAHAPAVRHDPEGMAVRVGELEESAEKYIGKTINVTGEVDDVFGPRLFKIDEPNWGDLDGEVLVYLPSDLAALVRDGDRVTVTGTMKMFVRADIERELGWLEPDPDLEIEFAERPVLMANTIVGGDSNVAVSIRMGSNAAAETAVGTSGTAGAADAARVTDASALARGGDEMIGKRVDLDRVKVSRTGKDRGFWIESGGRSLFVLPAGHATDASTVKAGDTVSVDGVVLSMPDGLGAKARGANGNDEIYVYASGISG
jgi:hypothetical protein